MEAKNTSKDCQIKENSTDTLSPHASTYKLSIDQHTANPLPLSRQAVTQTFGTCQERPLHMTMYNYATWEIYQPGDPPHLSRKIST